MKHPLSLRHLIGTVICLPLLLTACFGGGGGGGGGGSTSQSSSSTSSTAIITGSNTVTMLIEASTTNSVNQPYVTLTLCQTGNTANCTEIDHILVDTGSSGLRVLATAMDSDVLASLDSVTQDNVQLAECMTFGSGYTWGTIRTADLTIGSKTASALPVQIIADPNFATVPTYCQNQGASIGSRSSIGANGILGIGTSVADCNSICSDSATYSLYFKCVSDGSCTQTTVTNANQVPNPVSRFSSDNNGVLLVTESVPDTGATTASGTLVFGIDTQDNNQMTDVTVLGTSIFGLLQNISLDGTTYSYAFLDSGSNGIFFPSSMTQCSTSDWYCPTSTTSFNITLNGRDTASLSAQSVDVSFDIANADTLFATDGAAFNNLGAPASSYFDLGMPFFYGRSVYVAISGADTLSGSGPFVAF